MGFGRSGTSLMSGILHKAGYFMGRNLYPPRNSNPKGFFENAYINGINERILSAYDNKPQKNTSQTIYHTPYNPGYGQRWLSYIPPGTKIRCKEDDILTDIERATKIPNFAYKDPRFNYTLGIWLPYLNSGTIFICMFREPEITIQSVLTECHSAEYLSNFDINHKLAEEIWINSYQFLLINYYYQNPNKFVFIHYKQLLNNEKLDELSEILQQELKTDFININLNRTKSFYKISNETIKTYKYLCNLSGFKF